MKSKVVPLVSYIAVAVVLLVLSFFAGRILNNSATAVRAELDTQANKMENINSPDVSFYCGTINNIAAFNNRIHIRCSNDNNGIYYYAYANDTSNAMVANQLLAAANTAFALGKGVWVYYNSDSSFNPTGCYTTDCRGLTGISILQ